MNSRLQRLCQKDSYDDTFVQLVENRRSLRIDRTYTTYVHRTADYPRAATPKQRPDPIAPFEAEIQDAQFILGIKNELEDENFVPYSKKTLERATTFLRRFVMRAHTANYLRFGVPAIGPAGEGSVDVFWNEEGKKLLINFRSRSNVAAYYGNKDGHEISGVFNTDKLPANLIVWLGENN